MVAAVAALLALFAVLTNVGPVERFHAPPRIASVDAARGEVPQPPHIAVLALENKSYRQVIGSPHAPYLNRLARHYALASRYYSIGHPSLPNYLALTGGSTFGIHHNCAGCQTSAQNLLTQLDGARISWRAYFQGLPAPGSAVVRAGEYSTHYNPFTYFDRIRDSGRDRARILSFGRLKDDLHRHDLPRFTWIAPDLRHDGHDASLAASDRFAAHLVPPLLHALGPHGVLYLTWDEGARPDRAGLGGRRGGGQVALIAAGGGAGHGVTVRTPADHYALLRTIQANLRLPTLGRSGSTATPLLTGLLRTPR
jgi:hypothetical protein